MENIFESYNDFIKEKEVPLIASIVSSIINKLDEFEKKFKGKLPPYKEMVSLVNDIFEINYLKTKTKIRSKDVDDMAHHMMLKWEMDNDEWGELAKDKIVKWFLSYVK